MKQFLLACVCIPWISSAYALEHPDGSKNPDNRVCDVVYNPNDIVDVTGEVRAELTIIFRASEKITYVSASDTAHLKQRNTIGSNVLWLKANDKMAPQPISVRTLQEDGTPRDYAIQWQAIEPPSPAPAREPKEPRVSLASNNTEGVLEETITAKEIPVKPCYVIRYQYPADEKAAKQAAVKAQSVVWQQRKTEAQLRQQQMQASHNLHYVAMGDASIGPTEIFDDGYTTELHFPGNLPIPVILTVTLDGQESQLSGITTEDNGVIKLHGVYQQLRLRSNTLVLCIFNRAYNPLGNNPATGTTSPSIDREVRAK